MSRPLFILLCVALTLGTGLSSASAQTDTQRSACTRDVARACRAVMNDGDGAVLACLKENRARLSKGCQKMLTDNNQ